MILQKAQKDFMENNSKIRIGFFPYTGGLNPYIDILREELDKSGNFIVLPFYISIYSALISSKNYDVVYLNWYENIQGKCVLRTVISAIKRILILWILKMNKCKIIVFIHNRLPHNARNIKIIKMYEKIIYLMADRLAILSSGTKNVVEEILGRTFFSKIRSKFFWVHEPTYVGSYPEKNYDYRNEWGIKEDKFIYLFFGSIEPYKNIELALKVANQIVSENRDAYFVFYGASDEAYFKRLSYQISDQRRILLIPRKVENEKMTSLIRSSNVVIMPLNIESSINSGTCFLSLCYSRNIICPLIESLKDFKTNSFYTYSYKNEQEHYNNLLNMARTAIFEFYEDNARFNERIHNFTQEIKEDYSRETVYKQLSKLIYECMEIEQ